MPTARALLIVQQAEAIGTVIECIPDMQHDNVELDEGGFHIAVATMSHEEDVHDRMENPYIDSMTIRDISGEIMTQPPTQAAPSAGIETSESPQFMEEIAEVAPAAAKPAKKPEKQPAAPPSPKTEVARTQTVRVDITKLDTLLELVGELVIARGQVTELGRRLTMNPNADDAAFLVDSMQAQGMILTQLQEAIMDSRMVPVGNVLTRFRRLVRDLSHGIKKNVRLDIEGEETELDKKIIDMIGDPLTHLIRNAIDHGLETPKNETPPENPRKADSFSRLDARGTT